LGNDKIYIMKCVTKHLFGL